MKKSSRNVLMSLIFSCSFLLFMPSESAAFYGSTDLLMEHALCPGGGTYKRCWIPCNDSCPCPVSQQTTCEGGNEN